MKGIGILFVMALLLGMAVLAPANASQYELTPIGPIPGGTACAAYAVNDLGQVVGSANHSGAQWNHAFLWENGSSVSLGHLGTGLYSIAYDINNSSQIVGYSTVAADDVWTKRAFLWDSVNGMQDLGVYPGGEWSEAKAINESGQVVGYTSTSGSSNYRAFVWEDGTMTVLGTLGGDYSIAHDINNHGQVVGESRAPDGTTYAFLADAAGGAWTSLGSLPGGSGSRAYAINDAGQVVGEAGTPDGAHAFLWDSVNGMQDLGALPGGFMDDARANDINEFGLVVGESAADGNTHAFISQAGMMTDLDNLMADAGWDVLWYAHGINEAGQIVGHGYNDGNYGFLLTPAATPVPEPVSMLFFGTGLVGIGGLVCRRRLRGK